MVEYVIKKDLEDLAKEIILIPLQMNYTDYLWRNEFKEHFCYGHSIQQKKLPKDIETEDAAAAGSIETTLVDYPKFLEHILKHYSEGSEITQNMFNPNVRIKSKAQFGLLAKEETNENDVIELSYGLGWGLL